MRLSSWLLQQGKVAEDVYDKILFGLVAQRDKCSYTQLLKSKYHPSDNISVFGKTFTFKQVKEWCEDVDKGAADYPISLAKRVSLSDIENDCKRLINKNWRDLTYKEKNDILWEYGLDVKVASRYWVERLLHRNRQGKIVNGLCVVAQERTDREWLLRPEASFEAKVHSEDIEMIRDTSRMSRYT